MNLVNATKKAEKDDQIQKKLKRLSKLENQNKKLKQDIRGTQLQLEKERKEKLNSQKKPKSISRRQSDRLKNKDTTQRLDDSSNSIQNKSSDENKINKKKRKAQNLSTDIELTELSNPIINNVMNNCTINFNIYKK